ncbi:hypothetical protein HBI47_072260 [Parastagonospora nodorum]|nr:hypothetical protein HBI47_072260 [Parastagonospora nodorum]
MPPSQSPVRFWALRDLPECPLLYASFLSSDFLSFVGLPYSHRTLRSMTNANCPFRTSRALHATVTNTSILLQGHDVSGSVEHEYRNHLNAGSFVIVARAGLSHEATIASIWLLNQFHILYMFSVPRLNVINEAWRYWNQMGHLSNHEDDNGYAHSYGIASSLPNLPYTTFSTPPAAAKTLLLIL